MRFFAIFIAGFLVSVGTWVGIIYLILGKSGANSEALYQTYQIKSDAIASAASPKIIFVGGSGTLMGVGTEIISERINQPVYNLGIWAGLDATYQLHLLDNVANEGDIAVLSFEFGGYTTHTDLAPGAIRYFLQRDPEYFRSASLSRQFKTIFSLPPADYWSTLSDVMFPDETVERKYPISEINDHGDQTINRITKLDERHLAILGSQRPIDFENSIKRMDEGLDTVWLAMEALQKKKNIKFLVTYPNTIYFDEYTDTTLAELHQKVSDFFTQRGIKVLGTPIDSMYPLECFFDTRYHLNGIGVELRSHKVAEMLAEALPGISINPREPQLQTEISIDDPIAKCLEPLTAMK